MASVPSLAVRLSFTLSPYGAACYAAIGHGSRHNSDIVPVSYGNECSHSVISPRWLQCNRDAAYLPIMRRASRSLAAVRHVTPRCAASPAIASRSRTGGVSPRAWREPDLARGYFPGEGGKALRVIELGDVNAQFLASPDVAAGDGNGERVSRFA